MKDEGKSMKVEEGASPADRLSTLQDECNQLIAIFTAITKKAKSTLNS